MGHGHPLCPPSTTGTNPVSSKALSACCSQLQPSRFARVVTRGHELLGAPLLYVLIGATSALRPRDGRPPRRRGWPCAHTASGAANSLAKMLGVWSPDEPQPTTLTSATPNWLGKTKSRGSAGHQHTGQLHQAQRGCVAALGLSKRATVARTEMHSNDDHADAVCS